MTDANVVLGRIPSDAVLAGGLTMRGDLAGAAVVRLAAELDLAPQAAAGGIATVVEEVMAGAIRKVSLEEGADPRQAMLVAFGGAGGLHATSLARRLDMAGVLVPLHAGVFSALGLLVSPPRVDVAQSVLLNAVDAARLDDVVADVVVTAAQRMQQELKTPADEVEVRIDVRYLGQAHELSIPYTPGAGWASLAAGFHREHHDRNGFARPDDPIEVVTLRAAATARPALAFADVPVPPPHGERDLGIRTVMTAAGPHEAAVVSRPALRPGDEVRGPAIVEEPEATTFLAPAERAVVHETGALVVEW